MVVQDDVVPCRDWRERTYDRLDEADRLGYEAVTFYSAWPRARAELQRGRRWLRIPPRRFRNEQAVAMRLALAADYAAHADQFITGLPPAWHDVALSDFLAARGVSVWAALPNLVDHRLDVPSTVGHPRRVYGRERRSSTWHPEAR